MGYNLGVCPQCNNVMSMPDDSAVVRCPTCQAEVNATEAAALAGANQQMGGQQAPQNPYGDAVNMTSYQNPAPMFTTAPLLGTWQTNVLFTVLGVLAAAVFNGFVGASTTDANGMPTSSTMQGIFALIYVIFCIVYAVKIYPSYFSEKPMLTSNQAISFLNTFAGGLIFGLLWNHNLTRKEKGISNIVYVALIGASFVLAIIAVFVLAGAVASGALS